MLSDDHLCTLPVNSVERNVALQALGAGDYRSTIFARPHTFIDRMEDGLLQREDGQDASPTDVCLFQSGGGGSGSVRVSYQWAVPVKGEVAGRSPLEGKRYTVNTLPAEVGGIESKFSFSCVMPGKNRALSKQVQLIAWATFTGEPRGGVRKSRDVQHLELTYLMARKAVDVLGCENAPLQGDPVVVSAAAQ
ncbi:hypothetical protein ACFV08_05870 [Streptomyces fradiae]|uniref:hypothetical protein n=1 Tax=Streptomyces fradiae TaxID=1906 RepID=UPI00368C8CE4